jgi:ribosomal protein S18 acetylase RimI-like enzyme
VEIHIRKLEARDADAISQIYTAITRVKVGDDFKKGIEAHAAGDDNASFVAEYEGQVAGYLISSILTGSFGIDKSAWVSMLGVRPSFMGQGIGEQLAEAAFARFRELGIENVHTTVRWDSTDLLSFFKTRGFDRSDFINLHKKLG